MNKDYKQDSRALYKFNPNKSLCQLLDISPPSPSQKKTVFLRFFGSELSYIEVWFTDQNSKPQEIEHKMNITFVIN